VFAAANEAFIDGLDRKGLLQPGSNRQYAIGRIVLAVNKKSGVQVTDLKGLLDSRVKRIAIANPDHAPYGYAAREALMSAGVWETIQSRLVFGENIRQALQFVQTGNAEAGIIALSVANLPELRYRLIDTRMHSPLKQAAALVRGSRHERTARRFLAFVNGPVGRPIMKKYGFQAPERQ
jgi:molybdate transport system substrate-binding protein